MIRKRTLLSLESLEERTVLSTSPLQTSCGVGVDPYQSLWSSDAEILDGPILTTEDFSVGQSGSSPNNENQIQIITDLGDEVLPIPLNQNDLFTENNENLCQLECVDSDGNPIPLPNPGGPIQPPIPVPPGGWDVGLLPNEPVPFPFPGPIPPLPSPGEFDALLPSPRGGFPQPLPLPLPPFPQPLPLPSDGFGLLPPLPGESLPLPPLPFPPNPLPLPFPLPSDGLDQLPFPGDFDPIPLPGPIPPWGGDLPLPREANPLPFPLPLPLPPGGFDLPPVPLPLPLPLPPGGFDLPPVPLPLPLPGGFNPWQQFPPGFNPGGQGPNDGNLDFSPGRDNRTNDPKPNGEPQEDNRNGLFFGYSEEDKAGGYTFGFGAYRHEGKDGDIIGILTGDFDFGLFGEDGSRRRGFRANVQVLEVDSGRIDLGNNGFIQIDGKGPEANAAANGGQDGAELGVGASLIGTSVTLGTSDPNSDSDVQSRVGINVGVGAGGRLHWSDEDGDGFREFGVGVDVIFVSVDVKSEDPLKTLLVGPLGTYILSDDGNWTYGALDSATEFGEDAGEYIHDISQGPPSTSGKVWTQPRMRLTGPKRVPIEHSIVANKPLMISRTERIK